MNPEIMSNGGQVYRAFNIAPTRGRVCKLGCVAIPIQVLRRHQAYSLWGRNVLEDRDESWKHVVIVSRDLRGYMTSLTARLRSNVCPYYQVPSFE